MTEKIRYRCMNCGHRFEAERLTKLEEKEYREKNIPTSPVHCPKCNRIELREGWD